MTVKSSHLNSFQKFDTSLVGIENVRDAKETYLVKPINATGA